MYIPLRVEWLIALSRSAYAIPAVIIEARFRGSMSCPVSPSTGDSSSGAVTGDTPDDSPSRIRGYERPTLSGDRPSSTGRVGISWPLRGRPDRLVPAGGTYSDS
ncbi:hypothetical protein C9J85_10480 [Haloferax sp. wsp5]|nr:hypothetical protein C9J85_10480 [Haloferax sp. wsp5]